MLSFLLVFPSCLKTVYRLFLLFLIADILMLIDKSIGSYMNKSIINRLLMKSVPNCILL